jgi:membrane protein required for colicin V production
MYWLDYVIVGIIGISTLISLLRGFVREAFSLAIWLLAFWISWSFFRQLKPRLEPLLDAPDQVLLGASFGILMILSLSIGGLVNYLVVRIVEKTGLSGTDRFVGMVFGAARGGIMVVILVMLAGLTAIPEEPWWQRSRTVGYFEEAAMLMRDHLPEQVAQWFKYSNQVSSSARTY